MEPTGQDNATGSPALEGRSANPEIPEGAVSGDAYQGKTKEEVVAMHRELEKKLSEQGNELGQLRNFISRVGMFFKVDGDNVTLNDDMVKRYAEVQGWLQPASQETGASSAAPESQSAGGDGTPFEKDEQKSIREMIQNEIREAFKTSVEPLQQQFTQSQHDQWINQVRSTYSDFDTYRSKIAEFMNKTGYQVNSVEDLKNAYTAVKALSGGMVDKREADSHIGQLQRTLQVLKPGIGTFPKPDSEATNAELLGLETADTKEKRSFEALTGKPYYKS